MPPASNIIVPTKLTALFIIFRLVTLKDRRIDHDIRFYLCVIGLALHIASGVREQIAIGILFVIGICCFYIREFAVDGEFANGLGDQIGL
jgi:hypothetical protein